MPRTTLIGTEATAVHDIAGAVTLKHATCGISFRHDAVLLFQVNCVASKPETARPQCEGIRYIQANDAYTR
jgi:hypothetical protein